MQEHEFAAEIWASESVAAWAFVTLSPQVDEEVRLGSGPPTAFWSATTCGWCWWSLRADCCAGEAARATLEP